MHHAFIFLFLVQSVIV